MSHYLKFLQETPESGMVLTGDYEPALVTLSILVAVLTSSVALEIAQKVKRTESKKIRMMLLTVGAFAMGGGVWAMHFIGMLAFQICGNSGYDVGLTLLSLLPSILASGIALHLLSREQLTLSNMLAGGVLIGSGIGLMHYSGMAAMDISADLYYDPYIFALSIIAAVVLATLGVWVRFGLRHYFPNMSNAALVAAGGVTLGLAISSMHYIGMEAAVFVGDSEKCKILNLSYETFLAAAIAGVTIFIAITTLGLNLYLRYRSYNRNMLQEQSRRMAIYNTAVDGIIQIDHTGLILEYNPACERMFGYSRDEVIGQNVKMLMPGKHRREHDDYIKHYRDTGERKIIGIGREVEGRRKDGSQFPLELSVGEAFDPAGSIFIGILRDITERKQMEDQLFAAMQEARQAAESKTAFLTNMSHEIRTPMNAIIGFIEVVLSKDLDEEQRRQLEIVYRSARSLLRLLNDILDTAKLDQNAFELEVKPFDLLVLLDEMLSVFNNTAKGKGLNWSVEWDENIPPCYLGDITRIRQILVNLIGNAIKFTERGDVRLVARYHDSNLVLEVSDTGIGIPKEKLDDIFIPFAQTDASISRRFGGTGLGTAIAKQLVELMGGYIEVESELGQGSLFRVSIPLEVTNCPVSLNDEKLNGSDYSLQPLRILIAEDVSANAELLKVRLEGAGHKTHWVKNGQFAFEAIQSGDFDLVLMDVQMPEVDGLSATRMIREWEMAEGKTTVPIIALTAGAFQEDKDAAEEAGMNGFVTKPVQFNKLFAEMAYLLGGNSQATPASGSESQLFDGLNNINDINLEDGIARWGDINVFRDNLLRFADQYRDFNEKIENSLTKGDRSSATQQAHLLKGVAGNLALPRLASMAGKLETQLQQDHLSENVLRDLYVSLSDAVAEIALFNEHLDSSHPESDGAVQTTMVDSREICQLIADLITELHQGGYDEVLLCQLENGVKSTSGESDFKKISKAIDNFDFDLAVEQLRDLGKKLCPEEYDDGAL